MLHADVVTDEYCGQRNSRIFCRFFLSLIPSRDLEYACEECTTRDDRVLASRDSLYSSYKKACDGISVREGLETLPLQPVATLRYARTEWSRIVCKPPTNDKPQDANYCFGSLAMVEETKGPAYSFSMSTVAEVWQQAREDENNKTDQLIPHNRRIHETHMHVAETNLVICPVRNQRHWAPARQHVIPEHSTTNQDPATRLKPCCWNSCPTSGLLLGFCYMVTPFIRLFSLLTPYPSLALFDSRQLISEFPLWKQRNNSKIRSCMRCQGLSACGSGWWLHV